MHGAGPGERTDVSLSAPPRRSFILILPSPDCGSFADPGAPMLTKRAVPTSFLWFRFGHSPRRPGLSAQRSRSLAGRLSHGFSSETDWWWRRMKRPAITVEPAGTAKVSPDVRSRARSQRGPETLATAGISRVIPTALSRGV